MLRNVDEWDGQNFAFHPGGAAPGSAGMATPVHDASAKSTLIVPDAKFLFNADFKRAGPDLVLTGDEGRTVVIHDYFATEQRATLLSREGMAIAPHVVEALTGPLAPGQYAQAAGAQPAAQAVGRVAKVDGDVTVVRNGVAITVKVGDPILKGDVLQTRSGELGVTFNDGSTINLTENARLVVNEFIYDPKGDANSQILDLVQGSLTFISGEIAHSGDMKIGTPVATMGIRGTMGGVTGAETDQVSFFIVQSDRGAVLTDSNGTVIAQVVQNGPLILVRPVGPLQVLAEEVQKSPAQLAAEIAALQHIVSVQAVGQQIIQQFFNPNQDPNNPQSNGTDHTQIQIDIPKSAILPDNPGGDGNGNNNAGNNATVTVITGNDDTNNNNTPNQPTSEIVVPLPVNLPPINFGPLAVAIDEDNPLTFAGPNVISVFDNDTNTLTVTLSATLGTLTLAGAAGLAFAAGDGTDDAVMTFTGTQAAINAALNGLTFTPPQNYSGPASVVIAASDGNKTTTATIDITINPANDLPETTGPAGTATGNEDVASIAIDLVGTDVDGSVAAFRITALPEHGTLYADAGLSVVIASNNTVDAVANAATVYFVPDANWNGSTSLQFAAIDNLNGEDATPATATIDVSAVNDAPVLAVPGQFLWLISASENTPKAITGISVSDADAGDDSVAVTLSVDHGTLSISGTGLTIDGDGTDTLVVTGSLANINAALVDKLVYTSDIGFQDADNLTVTVNDQGHNGAGNALTDTKTGTISVNNVAPTLDDAMLTPINSAPANNAGDSISSIFSGKFHDTAGATLAGIAIVANTADAGTQGVWQYSTDNGTNWFNVPDFVNAATALVLSADSLLRFVPDVDFNGSPTPLLAHGLDNTYAQGFTNGATLKVLNTENGTGDPTPISSAAGTIGITVDAPVLMLAYVEDRFNSQEYSLNTGSVDWATNWIEINDTNSPGIVGGGNSPTDGDLLITDDPAVTGGNPVLKLSDNDNESGSPDTIQRTVNLAGATAAMLTFDYRRDIPNGDVGDIFSVLIGDGTNFIEIGQIGATGNGSFVDGTYQPFSADISNYISANTTIRFTVGDSVDDGDIVYVDNVKISYVPASNDYATSYVENASGARVAPFGNIITDVDSTTIHSATVTLTNHKPGDDLTLDGVLPAGIATTGYDAVSGVLVLTGPASSTDYQTALHQIKFINTSENPDTTDRIVNITVNDGFADSNTAQTSIQVTAVNDAPSINALNLVAIDGPNPTDTTVTKLAFSDADDAGDPVTLAITVENGTLTFDNQGQAVMIAGNNGATPTVSGTIGALNDLFDAGFVYSPAGTPETDKITMTLADAQGATDILSFVFHVNDPQVGQQVVLTGTPGKDYIFATGQDNTLTGDGGSDTFVFAAGDIGGDDHITDFNLIDDFLFFNQSTFANFNEFLDAIGDAGQGNTLIAMPNGTITLVGVSISQFENIDPSHILIV